MAAKKATKKAAKKVPKKTAKKASKKVAKKKASKKRQPSTKQVQRDMAAHTSEENAGDFTREALLGSAAGMTAIEDRIMLIHDIMLSGQWITRVTDRFLAQAWGMTRNRVHQMSCEASRMVRREIGADEVSQRKNMALGYLDMIKAFAVTGKKELLAGIAATKLEGQIVGFVVNRHEIKADTNPYKDYTLEELEHFGVTGETPARLSKEDE